MEWIKCTGDVCQGDTIRYTEAVFGGSHRRPQFLGERTVTAEVTSDSYGASKQQHTFTLLVRKCEGFQAIKRGKVIRRKARNVYRNGTVRLRWVDEDERKPILDEKHARGDFARGERQFRRDTEGFDLSGRTAYDASSNTYK